MACDMTWARSHKSQVALHRVDSVKQRLTYEVSQQSVRGFFEADRLMFTLLLAMSIDLQAANITQQEFTTFVRCESVGTLDRPKCRKILPWALLLITFQSRSAVLRTVYSIVGLRYFEIYCSGKDDSGKLIFSVSFMSSWCQSAFSTYHSLQCYSKVSPLSHSIGNSVMQHVCNDVNQRC